MSKAIAAGCGVATVFLVIAAFIVIYFVPQAVRWVEKKVEEEERRWRLAENWQPPAKDAGPDELFPKTVRPFQRDSHDDKTAIPEFRIDNRGRRAVYLDNPSRIDVFLYQMNDGEKEAIFDRIDEIYHTQENVSGYRQMTRLGYRFYYESPTHHQNHFWYMKGWLLIFRTEDSEDCEPFVKSFIEASSTKPKPAGK